MASGLAQTKRCDWTAAASLVNITKRQRSIVLSFARVRSQKGLKAWSDQVSQQVCPVPPREGPALEPGAVLTLFWSREVGMGPGAAAAGRRGRGLEPDGGLCERAAGRRSADSISESKTNRQVRSRTMEPARFGALMSRGKTADDRAKPNGRRGFRGGERFRSGEGMFFVDRNPIWMTPSPSPGVPGTPRIHTAFIVCANR